jgi:predicted  nucleic acid-binding Zn-ribbon protein
VTDEELDGLLQEISGEIDRLADDPEKPLSRKEKKHRLVLRARHRALERVKEARDKGNTHQEVKANMDYALLTEYGEKNILIYNLMKSRTNLWRAF